MIIKVKSHPDFWKKEFLGFKPSTVRELDGNDIIEICNTETGAVFQRKIIDISVWQGKIIISWEQGEIKNG